mgnify:CR=1 FL=1
MEGNFSKKQIRCLEMPLHQLQNSEQTLEIKLPEGMQDIGRVLVRVAHPDFKYMTGETLTLEGGMGLRP